MVTGRYLFVPIVVLLLILVVWLVTENQSVTPYTGKQYGMLTGQFWLVYGGCGTTTSTTIGPNNYTNPCQTYGGKYENSDPNFNLTVYQGNNYTHIAISQSGSFFAKLLPGAYKIDSSICLHFREGCSVLPENITIMPNQATVMNVTFIDTPI